MKMDIKEYIKLAVSTRSNLRDFSQFENILHCVIGCSTEAGELLDIVKKHMFYGKELDLTNIKEELGDILWYIANIIDTIEISFDDVIVANINKLKARYPNEFEAYNALNRNLEKERQELEKRRLDEVSVKDIIAKYLKDNGYDGLFNSWSECACEIDDLAPCDNINIAECCPGYKYDCLHPNECDYGPQEHWHIGKDKKIL